MAFYYLVKVGIAAYGVMHETERFVRAIDSHEAEQAALLAIAHAELRPVTDGWLDGRFFYKLISVRLVSQQDVATLTKYLGEPRT